MTLHLIECASKYPLVYQQGGLTTRDEMCLSFAVYYPRTRMATCVSYVNPEVLTPFFSNGRSTE